MVFSELVQLPTDDGNDILLGEMFFTSCCFLLSTEFEGNMLCVRLLAHTEVRNHQLNAQCVLLYLVLITITINIRSINSEYNNTRCALIGGLLLL
jgi:hypothetical protein